MPRFIKATRIRRLDIDEMELLARGYSSDEIVRVIEAGEDAKQTSKSAGSQTHPATHAAPMS